MQKNQGSNYFIDVAQYEQESKNREEDEPEIAMTPTLGGFATKQYPMINQSLENTNFARISRENGHAHE